MAWDSSRPPLGEIARSRNERLILESDNPPSCAGGLPKFDSSGSLESLPIVNRLTGVEIFEKYRNPCWDLYNGIALDSIENFLEKDTRVWSAILLMDVLEHFPKTVGSEVLRAILRKTKSGGRAWVATPGIFMEQGAAHGNKHETHHCLWLDHELSDLGFRIIKDGSLDESASQMILGVYYAM